MREIVAVETAESAQQAPEYVLDLSVIAVESLRLGGDVVLVVDDGRRQVRFGAGGQPLDAVRGALRLAAATAAHGRLLASRLERDNDVRTMVHLPERPTWVCRRCGGAWPCQTQRRQLVAKFADAPEVPLTLMTVRYAEATEDLGVAELPGLDRRFLGWIPAVPPAGRAKEC
ncbi:hypothetical protein ACFO1B_51360 [Dactylosporangium siamense]|uniref:Uncharacterized protein n=1 Tax=Dactylosporangium siamense TaxID=685454 RepID=A0A919UH21_9ACTN|nr:hypothetical protein [Dactylosporangium siamense]GIG51956.1 hypothetical protein Dsi01nite_099970 [Dactylosporangium siamense]